jgi:hypothetical protein
MALQMAVVRWLHAFARKRSHTDAVHTLKHLPLLMIDLEGLEHKHISRNRGRVRSIRTPDAEERVLDRVEENPGVSTKQMATELNVAQMAARRALPPHLQRVSSSMDCSAMC